MTIPARPSPSIQFVQRLLLVAVFGLTLGLGIGLSDQTVHWFAPAGDAIASEAQSPRTGEQSEAIRLAQAESSTHTGSGQSSSDMPVSTSEEPSLTNASEVGSASGDGDALAGGAQDEFNFFSDAPIESAEIVVIPDENPDWIKYGGPASLLVLMVLLLWITKVLIPFQRHSVDINLRNFPPAAKRGMAIAVVLFGIAFAFGASEIWYQMQFFGSSAEFIESMSLGKLIVMTHAHLFGFTTAFFIVGIPFSMQFNHIRLYQWIFPIGLVASLIDVMSWWGIKYVDHSFEFVSMVCALLFSGSYLFMLVGLLRTLAFPEVIWASDKDRAARIDMIRRKRAAKREFRKFFS